MQSPETAGDQEQNDSIQFPDAQQYWQEFEELINQRVAMAQEGVEPEPASDAWTHSYEVMADIVVAQFSLYTSMRQVEQYVNEQLDNQGTE